MASEGGFRQACECQSYEDFLKRFFPREWERKAAAGEFDGKALKPKTVKKGKA